MTICESRRRADSPREGVGLTLGALLLLPPVTLAFPRLPWALIIRRPFGAAWEDDWLVLLVLFGWGGVAFAVAEGQAPAKKQRAQKASRPSRLQARASAAGRASDRAPYSTTGRVSVAAGGVVSSGSKTRGTVDSSGAFIPKEQSHGNHVGEDKIVLLEETLALCADPVSEEGDAFEFFLPCELNGVFEEHGAIALATVHGVDDDVLHKNDKAALGRADGEEQVHHADKRVIVPQDEDAAAQWLLENEPEPCSCLIRLGVKSSSSPSRAMTKFASCGRSSSVAGSMRGSDGADS